MKAMVLEKAGTPLVMMELPLPHPQPDQVLVKVTACGVCRTSTWSTATSRSRPWRSFRAMRSSAK
jgi:D-arabinose 1-dehydrogenase-like Zn-dependent alcohol dehydrogenase